MLDAEASDDQHMGSDKGEDETGDFDTDNKISLALTMAAPTGLVATLRRP